jgi:(p)ppGpp synthase/HD superfamily hydrolase
MNDILQILLAAETASRWHVDQRRKGGRHEPYINHLIEVASLVAQATDGDDPNLVVAALLHDAVEDCGISGKLIADTFGEDVASIVAEVTDDKSLPKEVRKEEQVRTAATKSTRAKILKLADKISNLRAIAASPPADWPLERRIEYVRWARRVAAGLRGVNRQLEDELDAAADTAERSMIAAT